MSTVSTRQWRTLVRFVNRSQIEAVVVVPAWDSSTTVSVPIENIPEEIRNRIVPNFRCYAEVNIGSVSANELIFTNWSL